MHTLLPRLAIYAFLWALAGPLPAQETERASTLPEGGATAEAGSVPIAGQPLEVVGYPALAELLDHTRVALNGKPAHNDADLWQMMTALLRLGELDQATRLLAGHRTARHLAQNHLAASHRAASPRSTGQRDTSQPGLVLAAHATWHRLMGNRLIGNRLPGQRLIRQRLVRQRVMERRRTTDDSPAAGLTDRLLSEHDLEQLRDELQAQERAAFGTYSEAALQIHGRYCLALLQPRLRREHERAATARLLALEAQTWQPGRGHFRPRACNGAIALPAAADATLLQPLSFGMMLATGDRLTQHLTNTVAAARNGSPRRWQQAVTEAETTTLLLTAAAQLGDHATMRRTLARILPRQATHPGQAARDCNAALSAITGLRLAAGGGLDTRFVRITPWLPPGVSRLELRGLRAMHHTFDLTLQSSKAETQPQPAGELLVTVALQGALDDPMPLVLGNRQLQVVTEVRADHPAHVRLPQPKPTSGRRASPRAGDDDRR